LGGLEWPPKSSQPETFDELCAATGLIAGIVPARDQAAGVAAAEGVGGEPFGGQAVGLSQERRDRQRLILILEAVDKVLGRELAGWIGGVSKEVAYGPVVLAVGEAAQHGFLHETAAGGLFLAVSKGGGQLRPGKSGEIGDPRFQSSFFRTAFP